MFNAIKTTFEKVKQALNQAGNSCHSFDSHHYVDTCASVVHETSQWHTPSDPELQIFQRESSVSK